MENVQNEGVSKLLDVEKTTDVYLTELCEKMKDQREKLEEEKVISVQLQEIFCSLEGRMSVYYQRSEELGIDDFKEIMNRATEELINAKEESEDLSVEIFNICNHMIREVKDSNGQIEESRVNFKSIKSMEQATELESVRCEHVKAEIRSLENEILDTDNSDQELVNSMLVYEEIDDMIFHYIRELERTEVKINFLNGKKKSVFRI